MKILFFTVLATILVSLPVQSAIVTTNGVINCDGLICPTGSVKCTVAKKTSDDLSVITISRTCIDAKGSINENKEETVSNPNPHTAINSVETISGSSSMSSRPMTEEERKKMEEHFKEEEKKWQQWEVDFKEKLEASLPKFPPNFPFNN